MHNFVIGFKKDDGTMCVVNNGRLPIVKVVEFPRTKRSLVPVEENGWWCFRGIRPIGGKDAVKVYLGSKGTARLMRWGYVEGVVKPAPGSQYILNLGDIRKTKKGCKFVVGVNGQMPAIVPSVELSDKIKSVRIDGKV